jgi:nucleoside-diphosphate-sugar epimerase
MTGDYTLVTGATGFIGKALAAQLASEPDARVAILVRDSYRDRPLPDPLPGLSDRLLVVYADLRDYHATRRAVLAVGPQHIYHLAAGGVSNPFLDIEAALEQNLYGTLHLLRAAFEEATSPQPARVIVVRTPGELTAMNPYAASKAAAWQLCAMNARTRDWPITAAMPFQTYGPGQHERHLVSGAMAAAMAGEDFPMTAGEQLKDWIHISDVVDGLLAMRDARLEPATTIELGTGVATSVADVVRQIYDLVDGPGKPRYGALESRRGEESRQVADVRQAIELLDWQATVALADGLALTYEHLQRRDRS